MTPSIPQIFLRATHSTSTISLCMLLGPEIGISWGLKRRLHLAEFWVLEQSSSASPSSVCSNQICLLLAAFEQWMNEAHDPSGGNRCRIKLGSSPAFPPLSLPQEVFVLLLNKAQEILFSTLSIFLSLTPHESSPLLTASSRALSLFYPRVRVLPVI